jgi:autoinducer 2-degrading protein
MFGRVVGLLGVVVLASSAGVAQVASDLTAYAVTYVDVVPAAKTGAVAALKQYRDMSRKDDGFMRIDLFEQMGRPGHFAIIEAWKDEKAADAHGGAAHTKQLLGALGPVRSSGYDQRPYKPLTVAPSAAVAGAQTIYVITHVDTVPSPQNDPPGLLRHLAEDSRKDNGNLRFDVIQHTMRANHFTIVEAWQSQSALDAHAAAVHTKQYRDTLQPMAGGPLDERLYKAVE